MTMHHSPAEIISGEMLYERARQQGVENWSLDHDDAHSVNDWVALMTRYLGRAGDEAEAGDPVRYRQRLVQVGAIAIAAIESLDRVMEVQRVRA